MCPFLTSHYNKQKISSGYLDIYAQVLITSSKLLCSISKFKKKMSKIEKTSKRFNRVLGARNLKKNINEFFFENMSFLKNIIFAKNIIFLKI